METVADELVVPVMAQPKQIRAELPGEAAMPAPTFLKEGATGIVCASDLLAKGVISTCKQLGYRVPEDVSVIGFDNIPIAATTEPPLTTIAQQRNELGRCAYTTLSSLINHVCISKTLLRPQLVERESTAIAKK